MKSLRAIIGWSPGSWIKIKDRKWAFGWSINGASQTCLGIRLTCGACATYSCWRVSAFDFGSLGLGGARTNVVYDTYTVLKILYHCWFEVCSINRWKKLNLEYLSTDLNVDHLNILIYVKLIFYYPSNTCALSKHQKIQKQKGESNFKYHHYLKMWTFTV